MAENIKFGLLSRIKGHVLLTIDQAEEYGMFHSQEDRSRIISAILNDRPLITFPFKEVKRWIAEKKASEERDTKLSKVVELNNRGIAFEKAGEIEEAIKIYEENILIDYPAHHAYKRLMVIYRRKKRFDDEERVIKLAMEKLNGETEKYQSRLEKCRILKAKSQ